MDVQKIIFVAFTLVEMALGKIYDRCELAQELKYVHKAPSHQIATWVCIAEHESQYNTSIIGYLSGDGSGDHGIFQISDRYWCSPPGKGFGCGLTCAALEDDDISDDFICAQAIYKEHKQLSGDGFNAWAVYQPHCKGAKAYHYIKDCFSDTKRLKTFTTPASVFAHGLFPTSAERINRVLLTSTQKPAIKAFTNFESPFVTHSDNFAITTSKPQSDLLSTSELSLLANQLFTSTQNANFHLFYTPRTTTVKSSTNTATVFSTTNNSPQSRDLIIFSPTATALNSNAGTSSIHDFGKTFSSPSSKFFYTPAVSTPLLQTSTVRYPSPIFIINGVMWN